MPDAAIQLLRNAQATRRARMHTHVDAIPTGNRMPHPAEAAASGHPMTIAQMKWQRVLEVLAHRDPWIEMYLRGSRIEYADNREVHYSVIGEVAVAVLSRSPAMDAVHGAAFDVTGRRRHPVPHLSEVAITDEERARYRDDIARAQAFAVAEFAAEVQE